jgi:hypothetical protein
MTEADAMVSVLIHTGDANAVIALRAPTLTEDANALKVRRALIRTVDANALKVRRAPTHTEDANALMMHRDLTRIADANVPKVRNAASKVNVVITMIAENVKANPETNAVSKVV